MKYYQEAVDLYMDIIINEIKITLNCCKPLKSCLVTLTSLDVGYSKHTYILTLLVCLV